MFITALITTFIAIIAHHLGLTEEMARVISKIAKCPKCTTFWITLCVMLYCDEIAIIAVAIALLMAYLSNWCIFVLIGAQRFYDWLWRKLNKRTLSQERRKSTNLSE